MCIFITSIYPSTKKKLLSLTASLAILIPYRLYPLLKIILSGELRYLGNELSRTLPPKPIILFFVSNIGKITLFLNLS
jgi:hypothetical protein